MVKMAAQSSILLSMSSSTHNSITCSSYKPISSTNLTNPKKLVSPPISFTITPPPINSSRILNTINEPPSKIRSQNDVVNPTTLQPCSRSETATTAKLYAILEAVADRIEIHANIGEQRNNWNSLLLNSINMMTLTATTMAGLTAAQPTVSGLKLSSAILFAAATGLLMVVNKIQPSQLVEEQRNATRLFKQLHAEIQTTMSLSHGYVTEMDVSNMMERVFALDRAYPLPLIGVMLEKFPAALQPATWRPVNEFRNGSSNSNHFQEEMGINGWSEEMENEMREIAQVLKRKDKQDYIRLGNIALKMNKILSNVGPLLTGMSAVGSAFSGSSSSSLGLFIAVGAGALSTVVNSIEHGGQVGMVFEMYRNCAGFYQLMEEYIESSIGKREVSERENGELMEMKVALQLGRSLSEMKGLASTDEFASKLF